MRKVRNAVIIIILCIIGAYKAFKPAPVSLGAPPPDVMRDALAGSPVNASRPGLHLSDSNDDQFRDSVAGNAIPSQHYGPHGNSDEGAPPPPRGGGGGLGTLSGPNPGSQIPPAPLSQSGPPAPPQ